ncbi:MAG: glycosyltransferase family 2 protein [Candidatus Omnitrophica bacterium]|nr:hypothetical protein [bacterium]NUN98115.1 glycosyltransferase family 2 protein [Candidatus Omnitrophota bacterium]
MTANAPDVSIILVTWNRREDLREALDSIRAQEGITREILIIDNGSTDGTLEFLESLEDPIRIIRNPTNRGACVGKNQGILAAKAEVIAFMDSDAVLLNPCSLRDLRQRLLEHPDLGAVAGPIYTDRELANPWVFGIHFTDDLYIDWERSRGGLGEAEALSTCFMVMPRKVATEVGGFDPVFFYQHEDLDFFVRVRALGYRAEVVEGYPVWHKVAQTGRKVDRWLVMHFREEWRHQYLLIKSVGFLRAARLLARNLIDSSRMRAYYVRPIRWRKFVLLFVLLPILMLLLGPWILLQRGKNHLEGPRREMSRKP